MGIDYGKEVEKLKVKGSGNWWKPEIGTYEVVILNEGDFKTKTFEDKTVEQIEFEIEVNKEQHNWSVTRAETYNSLFGQLMVLAESKGSTVGLSFTLLVKGQGKNKDYTIIQAMDLVKAKMVEVEDIKEEDEKKD